jgi:hypothetical protein
MLTQPIYRSVQFDALVVILRVDDSGWFARLLDYADMAAAALSLASKAAGASSIAVSRLSDRQPRSISTQAGPRDGRGAARKPVSPA